MFDFLTKTLKPARKRTLNYIKCNRLVNFITQPSKHDKSIF